MESKSDKDRSSDFYFMEDPTRIICIILLTNKHANRETVMKITPPWWR